MVGPLIAGALVLITTPLGQVAFAFFPISLIFAVLASILFGVLPAFAAGLVFAFLALGWEATGRGRSVGPLIGAVLGLLSTIGPMVVFLRIIGPGQLERVGPELFLLGIGAVSGSITGAWCARSESAGQSEGAD